MNSRKGLGLNFKLKDFRYIFESRLKRATEEGDIKTISGKQIYSVRLGKLYCFLILLS